jgi:hypothetical protein
MYSISTLLTPLAPRCPYRVAKTIEIIESKEFGSWILEDVGQVLVVLSQMGAPIEFATWSINLGVCERKRHLQSSLPFAPETDGKYRKP